MWNNKWGVGSRDVEQQRGGQARGEPSKGVAMWSSKASGGSRKGTTSEEQQLGEVSEE